MNQYDLVIIGGGINGAGIARDAAGRGLSVLLVEQHDLAGATSSASSKLIHGGLRYLEYYEFRLVAEALAEREVLLSIAPHIIWPLEFVLPHEPRCGCGPQARVSTRLQLFGRLGGRCAPGGVKRALGRHTWRHCFAAHALQRGAARSRGLARHAQRCPGRTRRHGARPGQCRRPLGQAGH
jgi:glycerol-3-phosphate dehydrogenase